MRPSRSCTTEPTRNPSACAQPFSNPISTVAAFIKKRFYRLPARPLVKFFLLYVLKRGFLDGRPGFTYAVLQAMYEAMIVLKVQELERRC